MIPSLTFFVPGPPQNWQRTNHGQGRIFTDWKSREYRKHIQACARVALVGRFFPRDCRYSLALEVTYPDRLRRDVDNLVKQISDALNGIVYEDDSQVDVLHVKRLWDHSQPGVRVVLFVLPDPPPLPRKPRRKAAK